MTIATKAATIAATAKFRFRILSPPVILLQYPAQGGL